MKTQLMRSNLASTVHFTSNKHHLPFLTHRVTTELKTISSFRLPPELS